MNQFKNILGLPIKLCLSIPVRNSSISRSAGNNGRDPKRSKETYVATGDNDKSSEPRLSGRSYARLIADYSRAIEGQNAGNKSNGDSQGRATRSAFFSKTPFERLARVSSLVKIKGAGNTGGPSLSTRSSSTPAPVTSRWADNSTKNQRVLDDTEVLQYVTERADWLDRVVKAHKAKRTAKNDNASNDNEKKNLARPVMYKPVKSISRISAKEYNNMGDRRTSSVTKIDSTKIDEKNISVTVKPLKKSDGVRNEFLTITSGDNGTMLVTVTEESTLASPSLASPLRHIDLRINGQPAMGLGAVISKVETLDVVSSAEKIEITIPVLTDSQGAIGDNQRKPTSTINLCISNKAKGVEGSNTDGNASRVGQAGDSGSRSSFTHPSTVLVTKIRNPRKAEDPSSKVVPWWTTVESFQRSETIPARSGRSATTTKESATHSVEELLKARGNRQEFNKRDTKKVVINNAVKINEKAVTKPSQAHSSLGERSRARRKTMSTKTPRIITNELRKRSAESRENGAHRVTLNGSKPEAKHDNKVKNTASNEAKKGTSFSVIGGTMGGKSDQKITPMPDKVMKKVSSTGSNREKELGAKSTSGLLSNEDNVKNNNLSSVKNPKGNIRPQPIISIGKNNSNTGKENGTFSTGQISKRGETVGSKMAPKPPRQEFASKSKIKATPQLPRTYGNIKILPNPQSHPDPINRLNNGRNSSIKPNNKTTNQSHEVSNVKTPIITIKPIEKKKDGTLIDYGLTVSTRKKPERKLPDSRTTPAPDDKKMEKKDQPTVIATIKEVIPRRDTDLRDSSIKQAIVDPAAPKENGPHKNVRLTNEITIRNPSKQREPITKVKPNNPKDSKPSWKKMEKNLKDSSESKKVEATSPEKKLLYSVWLRDHKERGGQDPNSSKDPPDS